MRIVLNLIPALFCSLLFLLFIGWNSLDWRATVVLPYAAWMIVLLVSSLAWRVSLSPRIRQINAGLLVIALLVGILLVTGAVGMRSVWEVFVLIGFAGVNLYLYDLARTSGVYSGNKAYILLLPLVLTVYSLLGLFCWNGNLALAWGGLLLLVVLALIGLIGSKKNA